MSDKIKIIHVIGWLEYGGAELLLFDLCRKINKKKFDVEVVTFRENGNLISEYENAGIAVKIVHQERKLDQQLVRNLRDYFIQEKPDIIHTHIFAGDYYGGKAALAAKVPIIISTKHDMLDLGIVRNWLGRKWRRQFNKIIAISEATRENLLKVEKIRPEKIKVIYNGIDMARYYLPDTKILEDETVVFGSIGRLAREKGHKYLIRALKYLKNRNWQCILVGDGAERQALENQARKLGLEGRVRFSGDTRDVRSALAEMDVFVLPSLSEGLSLSLIEAAAAGKYIVASEVGGVPEIINHEMYGALYQPKNLEQLVSALNWVFDHRIDCSRSARSLQERVAEMFDINNIIKQYEELYESFVNK